MADGDGLRRRPLSTARTRTVYRVALDVLDLQAMADELETLGELSFRSEMFDGRARSVDELVATGETRLTDLTMSAMRPDFRTALHVSMTDRKVDIRPGVADDRAAAGVAIALESIVRQRSRRMTERFTFFAGIGNYVALAVLLVGILNPFGLPAEARGWATLFALPLVLLSLFSIALGRLRGGSVLLTRREEAGGWWVVNRDAFILQTYGVLGGGVAGFFVGLLVGN